MAVVVVVVVVVFKPQRLNLKTLAQGVFHFHDYR